METVFSMDFGYFSNICTKSFSISVLDGFPLFIKALYINSERLSSDDKVEKVFGLAAKNRLSSLLGAEAILQTQVSKKGEDMKGKFGRVLGNFISLNGEKCAAVLVREGHAVAYSGGSKENIASQHLANRERLVKEGKVVVPEGMSIAPIKNPPPPVENDPPNVKTATPKKTTAKKTTKKTTSKKK